MSDAIDLKKFADLTVPQMREELKKYDLEKSCLKRFYKCIHARKNLENGVNSSLMAYHCIMFRDRCPKLLDQFLVQQKEFGFD